MRVVILRGISGSGKSTYARGLAPATIVSADFFHVGNDGVYRFDPTKAKEAHDWCLREYVEGLRREIPTVVVDNTNISGWEYAPYYRLAELYRYEVEIITLWMSCPMDAFLRNEGRAPLAVVLEQYKRLVADSPPPHFKHTIIPAIFNRGNL